MTFQDGSTTRVLKQIKKDGVFVWCNNHLKYPKDLALFLNRDDIKIIIPFELVILHGFVGQEISDIRLDPNCRLTDEQNYWYSVANTRITKAPPNCSGLQLQALTSNNNCMQEDFIEWFYYVVKYYYWKFKGETAKNLSVYVSEDLLSIGTVFFVKFEIGMQEYKVDFALSMIDMALKICSIEDLVKHNLKLEIIKLPIQNKPD